MLGEGVSERRMLLHFVVRREERKSWPGCDFASQCPRRNRSADWEIVLSDSGGQEAVIASLALPEQDLKFTWSAEAAQRPVAECVRNCGLKITAGQVSPLEVVLRTPVSVSPLTLDLDKPTLSARWTIDALPDPTAIRAAVRLDGYPFILEPAETIPATAELQWVYLGDNREQVAIALQLKTNLFSRGLELSLLPHLLVPGKPLPDRMTKAKVKFRATCVEGKSQRSGYQALVERLQQAADVRPAATCRIRCSKRTRWCAGSTRSRSVWSNSSRR